MEQVKINREEAEAEPKLLLSSLACFWSVIEPVLLAAGARTVCEIGIGGAEFTMLLLEYCEKNSGHYSGIDPAADSGLKNCANTGAAEFFQEPSLKVLATLPEQDAYFIDGDHNYFTVLNELRLAVRVSAKMPLIFLHDVGWPWGRRDQYCQPAEIPAEFRQPHSSSLGVMPGRCELGPGGFSGDASDYGYSAAEREGGPRNGVLTAVEDFLTERPAGEWRLVIIPAVFGLGILYAPGRCDAAANAELERLASAAKPLASVIEQLERNRVELFLTYLKNVRERQNLTEHSAALLASYRDLHNHAEALQRAYDELKRAAFPPRT
jgi:hypothetical protein